MSHLGLDATHRHHLRDRRRPARRGQDILARDHPVLTGTGHPGQVDVQLGGQFSHRRLGPRALPDRSSPAGVHLVVGAVADQDRVAHCAIGARRREPQRRRHRARGDGFGLGHRSRDANQHRADGQRLAFGTAQLHHPAGVWAGNLDLGLVGLHRAQRLVQFDVVADRDVPASDRRVLKAFAQIRNQKLLHGTHGCTIARSTQSNSRSGPGSHSFSRRAGGYGVSNPVARNTGASRS